MLTAPPVDFGPDTEVPHDERYEIAVGYMEVVYKLWEGSWRDDAGETGEFAVEESPTDPPPGQALQCPWAAYLRAVTSMDPILILDWYYSG
jgi:alkanesulfonate monooxygenase SsuD/methylene tetrahydromethanopterin reductase-like flavin-dependent oxidoreductase (luciferase family)